MANQGDRIEKLEKTVFSNGGKGLAENVRNLIDDMAEVKAQLQKIADHTGPTRSELEALKKAIFDKLDLDALGNHKVYSAQDNPGRRINDRGKTHSAIVDGLRLLIVGVLSGVFLWLFTDILPRIFSVTIPPIH